MPRQNFTAKLPADIKAKLDKRIRDSFYATPESHADWLKSLGHPASRSGVSRYARALMASDGLNGESQKSTYVQSAAASQYRGHLTPREQILLELGELKVREAELLSRLKYISKSENDPESEMVGSPTCPQE